MNNLRSEIRKRGHWAVVIRPTRFNAWRVENVLNLTRIVEKCSVVMRGWDYPHIDKQSEPLVGADYIEQKVDWHHHREAWRLYQSGLFVHIFGIPEDWRDRSAVWPSHDHWQPNSLLSVADVLFTFSEIFEFAARLAMTEIGSEQMQIEAELHELRNRTLVLDFPNRHEFVHPRVARIDRFPYGPVEIDRANLVAEARSLALSPALELFRRFNWDTSRDRLKEMQEDLIGASD